jgi:hypothetical protein
VANIHIEMAEREFILQAVVPGFAVGDTVSIQKTGKGLLKGAVRGVTQRSFAGSQVTVLKIAVNEGNTSDYAFAGDLAGVKISKADGTEGIVRAKPNTARFQGRLLREDRMRTAYKSAADLITLAALGRNDDFVKMWFGSRNVSPTNCREIHRRCGQLNDSVKGVAHVHFLCGEGETLGAIDKDERALYQPGTVRIRIGRGLSYSRYSWGERVCTIIHELTHWFLDTEDVVLEGKDCYGGLCLSLAEDPVHYAKALNNADNWGYYICEYRGKGANADLWKNFTSGELASRLPFDQDGPGRRVDTSMVV